MSQILSHVTLDMTTVPEHISIKLTDDCYTSTTEE